MKRTTDSNASAESRREEVKPSTEEAFLLKVEELTGLGGSCFRPCLGPLISCLVSDTVASDTVIADPARYFADFIALAMGLRETTKEGYVPLGVLNHLMSHVRDICKPMTALPGGGQVYKLSVGSSGSPYCFG